MPQIERTSIAKVREFPEWLLRAIDRERRELVSITDDRARRVAEVELGLIEDRIKAELAEGH
jgi:hypothetical protein